MLGDWVDPGGLDYSELTPRPSDFLLGHFAAYGIGTGDTSWNDVVDACRNVIEQVQTDHAPNTCLLPGFLVPTSPPAPVMEPAPPFFLESQYDGDYFYSSTRAPWRIATHALQFGDPATLENARRLANRSQSVTAGDPYALRAGHYLDGSPLPGSNYFTTAFAAPFAVAAMTDPTQQVWLDDLLSVMDGQPGVWVQYAAGPRSKSRLSIRFPSPRVGSEAMLRRMLRSPIPKTAILLLRAIRSRSQSKRRFGRIDREGGLLRGHDLVGRGSRCSIRGHLGKCTPWQPGADGCRDR